MCMRTWRRGRRAGSAWGKAGFVGGIHLLGFEVLGLILTRRTLEVVLGLIPLEIALGLISVTVLRQGEEGGFD